MSIALTLPFWMIERIMQILGDHPYTGSDDIIQKIKEQMEVIPDVKN